MSDVCLPEIGLFSPEKGTGTFGQSPSEKRHTCVIGRQAHRHPVKRSACPLYE